MKNIYLEDFELPKFGTKEFNDLASSFFGGNPRLKEERERGITITHIGKQETIEDAAKKHALKMWGAYVDETHKDLFTETLGDIPIKDFTDGAKSDAARDYWFEQFKKEIK